MSTRARPIGAALHARADFLGALALLFVPAWLGLRPETVRHSRLLGIAGILTGLNTDYPYPPGSSRRLSFRAHRVVELLSFPLYLWWPLSSGSLRVREDRRYWLLALAVYLLTHLLTAWEDRSGRDGPGCLEPG